MNRSPPQSPFPSRARRSSTSWTCSPTTSGSPTTSWSTWSSPRRGVGARAHSASRAGPNDSLDMTVISGERPRTTTEESIGARGKRRTRGTYTLEEIPDGGEAR